MQHNPDRIVIWTGYFDARKSRTNGRRVSTKCAIVNPTLEGLQRAARRTGIRKTKRDENASHPSRAHLKEGRLWVSAKDALQATNSSSKEGILQAIGQAWKADRKEAKELEQNEMQHSRSRSMRRGKRQGSKRKRYR